MISLRPEWANQIDWHILSSAISFYSQRGYRYVDTPWIVPDEIARQTWDGEGLACQVGTLVGSAEQGFLTMDIEPGAKLVSCSPCFRSEPVLDNLHRQYFMKVELYAEGSHVETLLAHAEQFMDMWVNVERVKTPEGYDLMFEDIELGSYGERSIGDRHWTYGTGVALPRLTIAARRAVQTVEERAEEMQQANRR